MVRSIATLFLILIAPFASAATIAAQVRDARGNAVVDAVVYAVPDKPVPPAARQAVMDQKNRMFVPHVLPIQTGTRVRFPNSDDIRHQVYSFSAAKTFQLPLYKGTPANPVVFDHAGVATLGCNIHDRMTAYIVVVDTPHFGTTGRDGRLTLQGLGAGRYTVRVWYPEMKTEPASVPMTLAANERGEVVFTTR
jgi:plastocyanin